MLRHRHQAATLLESQHSGSIQVNLLVNTQVNILEGFNPILQLNLGKVHPPTWR